STPNTEMPGRSAVAATRHPASKPPPPTGITRASMSGASFSSSSARVPWPAMTAASSYGWTKMSWRSCARCSAWAAASARVSPCSTTSAPQPAVRLTLVAGVKRGITMVAATPANWACRATACAWLPADMAMTPRARSPSESKARRLAAPRSLKAPVTWRLSSFRTTSAPIARDTVSLETVGVRMMRPAMRPAASWTSAREIMPRDLARAGEKPSPDGALRQFAQAFADHRVQRRLVAEALDHPRDRRLRFGPAVAEVGERRQRVFHDAAGARGGGGEAGGARRHGADLVAEFGEHAHRQARADAGSAGEAGAVAGGDGGDQVAGRECGQHRQRNLASDALHGCQ